jgi:hypothetical protein
VYLGESDVSEEDITAIFRVKDYARQEIGGKQLWTASAGYLHGLLFDPGDGGDTFLRIVRLPSYYVALQLRSPYKLVIAIYCQNHTEPISTLCGYNADLNG